MHKLYPLFGMLSFLLLAGSVSGQPLDSLIAQAYRNNPDLSVRQMQYEGAMERREQVNQLPDPEIGVGIFLMPVETRVGPQRLRLSATQRLPWMGTLDAREDLALASARNEYLDAEILQLDLEFNVRRAFYRLYEIKATQQVMGRNLDLHRSLENFALAQVESGQGSTADVLRAQLRINETEQEIERLANETSKPLASLNELLDRPLNTPVVLPDTLSLASVALNRDTVRSYLQAYHPRLRQLGVQQAVAEQAIAVAELDYRPSFSVGLDYIMTGKRRDVEIDQNGRDALLIRGSVNVPLFPGQYEARRREETLRIDALEQQKRSWENRFLVELEQAYADYRDAVLALELYRKQQAVVDSALDILVTQYSNEGTGFDEMLNLYLQQYQYELGAVQAVVQSHLARAAIDRLVPIN